MKFRHFTTLHTDFDAEECRRRLLRSIDPERRTIFSLSGYGGSKPVIGRIDGYQLYFHKRPNWYWRNDFRPQFYGNLRPEARGTIIEGYFDSLRWAKIFMRIWLGGVILLGSPVVILVLLGLLKGRVEGDLWFGLLVILFMVLFGIFLPRIGLEFGSDDERFILEFLLRTLVAKTANPTQDTTSASDED
jgi:hypothetical protein